MLNSSLFSIYIYIFGFTELSSYRTYLKFLKKINTNEASMSSHHFHAIILLWKHFLMAARYSTTWLYCKLLNLCPYDTH